MRHSFQHIVDDVTWSEEVCDPFDAEFKFET